MSKSTRRAARKAALTAPVTPSVTTEAAVATAAAAAAAETPAPDGRQWPRSERGERTVSRLRESAPDEFKRPDPPPPAPLPAHLDDDARTIAHDAAGGLTKYVVVAPRTLFAALSPSPSGPESVEFAPAHCVPGNRLRLLFDPAAIGAETALINEQAAKDAKLRALDAKIADYFEIDRDGLRRKNRPAGVKQPRWDMGDYQDDEYWEAKYPV